MTLRRQILLFLLLFGLAPLTAVVVLNMPMVISQLERFYHEAHLQNLRADFKDIDQHIASRNETVRLLAKLPEPGMLENDTPNQQNDIVSQRKAYLIWLDRVLRDQLDIINIQFLDTNGLPMWRLSRNPSSGLWEKNPKEHEPINAAFIAQALSAPPGRSFAGPIHHTQGLNDIDELFLRLSSPVHSNDFQAPIGAVIISIDIGGLAHAYRQTYWVFQNGEYLNYARPSQASNSAFEDFPGLENIFTHTKAALWNPRNDSPVIWIPMFPTSSGKPLWVGRKVDPSPLTAFKKALSLRVLAIIATLVLGVLFAARLIAKTIERYQRELTHSLEKTLSGKEMVKVPVRGPGELKNMAATLNQLAEQHATNNRTLREHTAELEISNRYKSQFLANVSHELRTPLNSVLLLSKMLADDDNPPLTDEQSQQATVINKAGTDLKNMIDNILDLSRIEARRCTIISEPIDLPTLLEEIREIVAPQFDAKNLTLDVIITDGARTKILTDGDKLAQIVKNFLSNSIKFTKKGSVKLILSEDKDSPEQSIKICVSDPGRGIPKTQQTHIFEAFQQADGATNRLYGGTGLGLTISRELARLLGGRISLLSQSGEGSTFCLHLPLEINVGDLGHQSSDVNSEPKTDPKTIEASVAAQPVNRQIAPRYSNQRVMIIDSDLKAMLKLTAMLEQRGFEVTGALDHDEAVENLEEEHYDIIINAINPTSTQNDAWINQLQEQSSRQASTVLNVGDKEEHAALVKPIDQQQLDQWLNNSFRKDA